MKVVELMPALDCENIAKGLRNIADDIEAGAYDFDPTMASVVLGRESQRTTAAGPVDHFQWQSHGLGKGSIFAHKGLLMTAAHDFEGGN